MGNKVISYFESQHIGGRVVAPLVEPTTGDNIMQAVSGSVNLLWFALHIALAKGDLAEAHRLGRMIEGIVAVELEGTDTSKPSEMDIILKIIDDALLGEEDESEDEPDKK